MPYHRTALCFVSLLLAGCAAVDERPLWNGSVTPPALRPQAPLLQAELSGQQVLGVFNVSTQYDVQPGQGEGLVAPLGQQRFAQRLDTSLPLPLGSPLQLGVSRQQRQALTASGLLAEQQSAVSAQWHDGDLRFALNAQSSSTAPTARCGLDATLSTPLHGSLRRLTADADALRFDGQVCQRLGTDGGLQRAQIISAETQWQGATGAQRLRLSRVVSRDVLQAVDTDTSAGLELGAQQAMRWQGWSFSQDFTLRTPDGSAPAAGWGLRSQLSRKLLRVPVVASWQRHDAGAWSTGGSALAGRELSLGFDLSAPLQRWLTPTAGANLAYRRLDPDDGRRALEEQVQLGVRLGW